MLSRPRVCRAADIAKVPLITARRPAVRACRQPLDHDVLRARSRPPLIGIWRAFHWLLPKCFIEARSDFVMSARYMGWRFRSLR